MRTIKFRGKHLCGQWYYGNLIIRETPQAYKCVMIGDIEDGSAEEVEEETIGQFTGLFDKNGKEIYEGDILRYPPKDNIEVNNYVSYEVFWHNNDSADRHIGWQMNRHHFHGNIRGTYDGFTTCLPKYTKKMIIIGNVHDNPELLKGE